MDAGHFVEKQPQVHIDLCHVGVVFDRSLFESANANIDNRDLEFRIQFHCSLIFAVRQSDVGRGGLHDIISDWLDSSRRAHAHALALVGDRSARGLDFRQRRI